MKPITPVAGTGAVAPITDKFVPEKHGPHGFDVASIVLFPKRIQLAILEQGSTARQIMRYGITYKEKYLVYIKAFCDIGADTKLFPKKCSTCGREYSNFPRYIQNTAPVSHGLEPYTDSLDSLHTMQYRNCRCGSTLCINLTEEHFPLLESFWEMLGKESKESNRKIREVVLEFREQCNTYIAENCSSVSDADACCRGI